MRRVGVNPLFLLPFERSYFSYPGSLTELPCAEGVEWLVMAEPLEVDGSYGQRLLPAVGRNTCLLQPLNDRPVLAVFRR